MQHVPHTSVLRETPNVLVLYKPHALPFHQGAGPGVMQVIRWQQSEGQLGYDGPLYPVHRLDTVTSGALLLAKSSAAAGQLARAFRERRVGKYYIALSDRPPSKKQGSVVGDMVRGRRGGWLLQRSAERPAVTRFTSAAVPGRRPGLRAFLLRPETGRTHQLRVALKSLGSPVLGDARYARCEDAAREGRAYLHCAALRVLLPGGEALQVVVPPRGGAEFESPEFRAVFDAWLPPGLEADEGEWFPDSKLLRSRLAPPLGLFE